jgi:hypothetical protein
MSLRLAALASTNLLDLLLLLFLRRFLTYPNVSVSNCFDVLFIHAGSHLDGLFENAE